jgi:DNA-binding CsgD family transcriptional regulator
MPITTPVKYHDIYNDKDHFVNVLKHFFTPALEKAGFEAISPKSTGSDLIHADIITNLSNSDLVLCDMSILNSNVFFEFGIRCALDKPVALVKDDKTETVPFDTGIINFHPYKSVPKWGDSDEEINLLSEHIKDSYNKSNGHNALWKYFGVNQTGAFNPGSVTESDKLDFIIQKLSIEKSPIEYQESVFAGLTRREMHVLLLISEGKPNREISNLMGLEEGTVRNYVTNILSKLGLNNRTEAAAYAAKNDLASQMNQI